MPIFWTLTSNPGRSQRRVHLSQGSAGTTYGFFRRALTTSSRTKIPTAASINIANRPPSFQSKFPAKDIVDAGFLELVRYGIRKPDDSLIVDSLRVVDAVLKVETPFGPCWHRYNNDGYGQKEDGGPFVGWGKGRGWPLLAGERGHYELAAGHDARVFIRAMEGFSSVTGLLPEQVWDELDRPTFICF